MMFQTFSCFRYSLIPTPVFSCFFFFFFFFFCYFFFYLFFFFFFNIIESVLINLKIAGLFLSPGPSCSKLTMSLVNDSLKFTSSDTQIC